jgi:DNA primase
LYKKGQNLYGLWLTKQEIREKKEVIVVEGEFDLISPYQAGIKNIVAIKGTAFTPEQAKLINRFADSIVFCLDADAAGSEAVKRSAGIVEKEGLELKVAVLPDGYKDPDDLARDKPKLLKKVIKTASPVYEFVISQSVAKNDPAQPSGQRRILKEVLPFVNEIENAVVRQHYLKKIADVFGVTAEAVMVESKKMTGSRFRPDRKSDAQTRPATAAVKSRRQLLEEQLIGQIFASRGWKWFKKGDWRGLITTPRVKKIVKAVDEYIEEEKKIKVKKFFETLPEELKIGFEEIFLVFEEADDQSDDVDIQETILELSREDCRDQMSQIADQISGLEKSGEGGELTDLEKEFVEISQKLSRLDKSK